MREYIEAVLICFDLAILFSIIIVFIIVFIIEKGYDVRINNIMKQKRGKKRK